MSITSANSGSPNVAAASSSPESKTSDSPPRTTALIASRLSAATVPVNPSRPTASAAPLGLPTLLAVTATALSTLPQPGKLDQKDLKEGKGVERRDTKSNSLRQNIMGWKGFSSRPIDHSLPAFVSNSGLDGWELVQSPGIPDDFDDGSMGLEVDFNLPLPQAKVLGPNKYPRYDVKAALAKLDPFIHAVLEGTPKFSGYQISLPDSHPNKGIVLTGVSLRPSNFFLRTLFNDIAITTLPGPSLFAFRKPHDQLRTYLKKLITNSPKGVVSFSAKNQFGAVKESSLGGVPKTVFDLSEIYGDKVYEISYREIHEILNSQRIYTSPLMPVQFYLGLKRAMKADKIVELPVDEKTRMAYLLDQMTVLKGSEGQLKFPNIASFLAEVEGAPKKFGFKIQIKMNDNVRSEASKEFDLLKKMSLYQLGSMVVKSEDYHVFVDGGCKIRPRKAGTKDVLRLINMCGIRDLNAVTPNQAMNQQIMIGAYRAALAACESGFIVLPAVGLGVWGGGFQAILGCFVGCCGFRWVKV